MNKRKLLSRIWNNQKNVNFHDFVSLVEAHKFYCAGGKGSHSIFKCRTIAESINIQNDNGNAKPYQVKQFLSLITKYNLKLEGSDEQ